MPSLIAVLRFSDGGDAHITAKLYSVASPSLGVALTVCVGSNHVAFIRPL